MKDDKELEQRNQALKERLITRKKNNAKTDGKFHRNTKAYNEGFKSVIEFTATILVGCALGYFVDVNVGTLPWGLISGVLLGFVTGIYNFIRNDKIRIQHTNNQCEDTKKDY